MIRDRDPYWRHIVVETGTVRSDGSHLAAAVCQCTRRHFQSIDDWRSRGILLPTGHLQSDPCATSMQRCGASTVRSDGSHLAVAVCERRRL